MPTYLGSDGAPLHYEDLHHGTSGDEALPVIALAGGAARHPSYLGDLAGVGDRQRLIVPHLRGVASSPMPESVEAATFWRQAEDVERLRIHLGLQRVLLLAHSAGTRLAVSYAAQFPRHLAGMVLITPPAGYLVDEPSDAEELASRRRGEPVFDAAMAAWQAGFNLDDPDAFNAWQQRVAPIGYAAWGAREQAHASAAHYSLAAARAYFSVDPPPDLAARLGEVKAPVLVVAGAEDCITGLAPVAALAELFQAARAVVIERCGHYPWVEQPAEFRKAVDGFLSTLSLSGSGAQRTNHTPAFAVGRKLQ
ncbi:MAG TPA: alpha/beta hydrolase [Micromonosporaceae bacterium]|nr:alpha/beta hydrolase [Micromonosporaceae bacterium]